MMISDADTRLELRLVVDQLALHNLHALARALLVFAVELALDHVRVELEVDLQVDVNDPDDALRLRLDVVEADDADVHLAQLRGSCANASYDELIDVDVETPRANFDR